MIPASFGWQAKSKKINASPKMRFTRMILTYRKTICSVYDYGSYGL
jgi:hypothetical protein